MKRSVRFLLASLLVCSLPFSGFAQDYEYTPSPEHLEQAREILEEVPLIDGHNDTPWQFRARADYSFSDLSFLKTDTLNRPMHTDITRLKDGGVGGQFWSVFVPTGFSPNKAIRATFEQIDFVHRMASRYPETFEIARTSGDIGRIHKEGKIASLIGAEGGHSIGNSLGVLREFFRSGVRYMTLTHADNTDWADSATDQPEHGGLTEFGRKIIREMNRLGMLIDLSHVSVETMEDALQISKAPVIFSHSSARQVTQHVRNVPDSVLNMVEKNGGVVMVTYVTSYVSEEVRQYKAKLSGKRKTLRMLYSDRPKKVERKLEAWKEKHPQPRAHLEDVADHIDYIKNRIGVEHVGIGADYDGTSPLPVGLSDVSTYPNLIAELLERGYSEKEIKQIAGENILRVMRKAEQVSEELSQKETPATQEI